jgi:hypothetical protein
MAALPAQRQAPKALGRTKSRQPKDKKKAHEGLFSFSGFNYEVQLGVTIDKTHLKAF